MAETIKEQLLKQVALLNNDRSSFEPHWRELSDFINPRGSRFLVTDVNRNDRRNSKTVDPTATLANRTLSSGMMSGITSPARPWFKLATPDPDMMDYGPVKLWLEAVQRRMNEVYNKSNLYQSLPLLYSSLGTYSTGAMAVLEDDEDVNTSIWLVVWGENTVHGIFPKGQKAGIQMEDKGQQTLKDANGGQYEGYRTHYKWDNGLCLRDWRYVVRIANIDISDLSDPAAAANISKLMVKALHRIPNRGMGRPVFYMNRTVAQALDLQSLEKSSLAISVKETEGEWWTSFRGVPIRETDALLETEARVV